MPEPGRDLQIKMKTEVCNSLIAGASCSGPTTGKVIQVFLSEMQRDFEVKSDQYQNRYKIGLVKNILLSNTADLAAERRGFMPLGQNLI